MLNQGLWLMLVGMGTVFAFLTLLVGCMHAASAAFASFPDDPTPGRPEPATADDELLLIAVALAAAEKERA